MKCLPVAVDDEQSLSLPTKNHEPRTNPELDMYTGLDTRDALHPVSDYKLKCSNQLKFLFIESDD